MMQCECSHLLSFEPTSEGKFLRHDNNGDRSHSCACGCPEPRPKQKGDDENA